MVVFHVVNILPFINPTNFPRRCIPSLLFSISINYPVSPKHILFLSSYSSFSAFPILCFLVSNSFHLPDGPRYLLRFLLFTLSLSLTHSLFIFFSCLFFSGVFCSTFSYLLSFLGRGRWNSVFELKMASLMFFWLWVPGFYWIYLLIRDSRSFFFFLVNVRGVIYVIAWREIKSGVWILYYKGWYNNTSGRCIVAMRWLMWRSDCFGGYLYLHFFSLCVSLGSVFALNRAYWGA